MASYQDIDARLRTVESKIDFVMSNIKMQRMEGIINPVPVVVSLLDLYYTQQYIGRKATNVATEALKQLAEGVVEAEVIEQQEAAEQQSNA